jgi:hypothetical protein
MSRASLPAAWRHVAAPYGYGDHVAFHPGFGVLLTRLLEHRGTSIKHLSSSSAVPESELRSILGGGPVHDPQLRALSPVLGLHTADLFVIADVPVPEDLRPLDREAGTFLVGPLLHSMLVLPSEQRLRIHRLVDQLPQAPRPRTDPAKPPRTYEREKAGIGAMLLGMLCDNRNLHSPVAAAKTVTTLTQGRVYLAASTYAGIGSGRVAVRPEWVSGFATTLGISADDLAVITGIGLPDTPPPDDPLAGEMAELIWKFRRLSAAQAEHVSGEAKAMLVVVPEDGP